MIYPSEEEDDYQNGDRGLKNTVFWVLVIMLITVVLRMSQVGELNLGRDGRPAMGMRMKGEEHGERAGLEVDIRKISGDMRRKGWNAGSLRVGTDIEFGQTSRVPMTRDGHTTRRDQWPRERNDIVESIWDSERRAR